MPSAPFFGAADIHHLNVTACDESLQAWRIELGHFLQLTVS